MRIIPRRLAITVAAGVGSLLLANGAAAQDNTVLTLLHFNDGESEVLPVDDAGGAARFIRKMDLLRDEANKDGAVITLSSGDNYLAGPRFNANLSLPDNQPYYDTLAIVHSRVDALAIGNHEFDFGPDVFARVAAPLRNRPYLSANLDFSGEPALQRLVDAGQIARSTVITRRGMEIGVIGATTPRLSFISSPGKVVVDPDVIGAVQAEIDKLEGMGVNKIILISHLQGIDDDLDLIPNLFGVDIVVAGGGDELLANEGDLLVPGDEEEVFGPYPLMATNADGAMVPVVTTSGQYKYIGQLAVEFDASGNVVEVLLDDSGPKRVVSPEIGDDGVGLQVVASVGINEPVRLSVAALDSNVIAQSEVGLDGVRGNVRTRETNQGNLITDAFIYEASRQALDFGAPLPDVALANGGGIRNDSVIDPGDITELDTFDMLPFSNFLVVIPEIPRSQFKEIMENAVSRVEFTDGRFAQIAGFTMVYDADAAAQVLNPDGTVATAGERVQTIMLDDGTMIVDNGMVVDGDPINIATVDFLARGGDQYPYRDAPFTILGVSYQQALASYITEGLEGVITEADYPEGGEGRIIRNN